MRQIQLFANDMRFDMIMDSVAVPTAVRPHRLRR